MKGVYGKCKLENPCESFCLEKAWHEQFLDTVSRQRAARRVRCDTPKAKRESASRCSRFPRAVSDSCCAAAKVEQISAQTRSSGGVVSPVQRLSTNAQQECPHCPQSMLQQY